MLVPMRMSALYPKPSTAQPAPCGGQGTGLGHRDPESIGEALADAPARPVQYLPVPVDGARRAAGLLADLL
jgi:hypothetical protein